MVTAEKLAQNAVLTEKIYDRAITTAKLADSSVTSAKIQNGTVVAEDLAEGSVTNEKIANNAITSSKIAEGTITGLDIDFSSNGFVKAAAYVLDGGEVARYFNNLAPGTPITANNSSEGTFTVDFGTNITNRYFQVTPVDFSNAYHTVIADDPTSTSITIKFYETHDETITNDPNGGFYIVVY
ncbi:MAG: hypothetical protein QXU75_08510 [Candidatus Methanomethylicaceae archaeon]